MDGSAAATRAFRKELARLQRDFIGRPTALYEVAPEALADGARTETSESS